MRRLSLRVGIGLTEESERGVEGGGIILVHDMRGCRNHAVTGARQQLAEARINGVNERGTLLAVHERESRAGATLDAL